MVEETEENCGIIYCFKYNDSNSKSTDVVSSDKVNQYQNDLICRFPYLIVAQVLGRDVPPLHPLEELYLHLDADLHRLDHVHHCVPGTASRLEG